MDVERGSPRRMSRLTAPPLVLRLSLALVFVLAACKSAPEGSAASGEEVPVADCPAFTAAGRLPSTLEEVASAKLKGATWTNREIRARYVCWAAGIGSQNDKWKAEGIPVAERARRAYQSRRDARVVSRAMMSSATEIAALEQRDREKYGTPDGPTFEWLVKRAEDKGQKGDAVFEEIIQSSQRTDKATNTAHGL